MKVKIENFKVKVDELKIKVSKIKKKKNRNSAVPTVIWLDLIHPKILISRK